MRRFYIPPCTLPVQVNYVTYTVNIVLPVQVNYVNGTGEYNVTCASATAHQSTSITLSYTAAMIKVIILMRSFQPQFHRRQVCHASCKYIKSSIRFHQTADTVSFTMCV